MFDNDGFPPDAEFGCFQVVKGPSDTDFADVALVRLDVGKLPSVVVATWCGDLQQLDTVQTHSGHACANLRTCFVGRSLTARCPLLATHLPLQQ